MLKTENNRTQKHTNRVGSKSVVSTSFSAKMQMKCHRRDKKMAIAQNFTQTEKCAHAREVRIYCAEMRARSLMQNADDDDENDWNIIVHREWIFVFKLL